MAQHMQEQNIHVWVEIVGPAENGYDIFYFLDSLLNLSATQLLYCILLRLKITLSMYV